MPGALGCVRSPSGGENSNCTKTAGDPGVVCPGYRPPPPPPPPAPAIWDPACGCADYCDYKCANNGTGPRNLTLYRLTPYDVPGIDSMNTADPGGDVAFALERKGLAVECEQNPQGERCFLAHQNLYGAFTVEVDGQWGPYQFCNPTTKDGAPDTSKFACCQSFDHDDPGPAWTAPGSETTPSIRTLSLVGALETM